MSRDIVQHARNRYTTSMNRYGAAMELVLTGTEPVLTGMKLKIFNQIRKLLLEPQSLRQTSTEDLDEFPKLKRSPPWHILPFRRRNKKQKQKSDERFSANTARQLQYKLTV
ncbi:hypothetical protein Trydic_g17510 [Trypoxylus dichotomus]